MGAGKGDLRLSMRLDFAFHLEYPDRVQENRILTVHSVTYINFGLNLSLNVLPKKNSFLILQQEKVDAPGSA